MATSSHYPHLHPGQSTCCPCKVQDMLQSNNLPYISIENCPELIYKNSGHLSKKFMQWPTLLQYFRNPPVLGIFPTDCGSVQWTMKIHWSECPVPYSEYFRKLLLYQWYLLYFPIFYFTTACQTSNSPSSQENHGNLLDQYGIFSALFRCVWTFLSDVIVALP